MTDDARWDDAMPEVYDRMLGPTLFAPYAAHLAGITAALAPARVLEVAAGTGIVTRALVDALPGAEVVATDLNPAMVSYARRQVPGARWQVADAQRLPFPDADVDLVLCQFGAMFFPDRPAAYAEAARVLRPGAPLLLAVWDTVEHVAFIASVVAALDAVLPDGAPDFVSRVPHGYGDPAAITADLQAGGFAAVEVERVVLDGTCPSAGVLAEGFCLGTPLRFALAQRGPLARIVPMVADELERRLGAGPIAGPLAAYVATATTSS